MANIITVQSAAGPLLAYQLTVVNADGSTATGLVFLNVAFDPSSTTPPASTVDFSQLGNALIGAVQ